MADHMLTLDEARMRGLSPDPLEFVDCTHRVPQAQSKPGVRFYESRYYFVLVTEVMSGGDSPFPVTWLSIRRNDRKAMQDWRHLQAIKNALTGPEREAVQLYPAESRMVDESNQIHLWVLPEGAVLPFGYGTRNVVTATESAAINGALGLNSVQRAFDPETEARPPRPLDDLLSQPTTTIHRTRES